jgi:Protein of unknown function (DUF1566)
MAFVSIPNSCHKATKTRQSPTGLHSIPQQLRHVTNSSEFRLKFVKVPVDICFMRLFKPLMIIASMTSSCEKLTHVYSIRKSKPIPASSMHITKITPLAAKPGVTVTVEGSDIGYQSTFMVGETVVTLHGTSGTTATFTMPETTRSGAFKISVGRPDNLIGIVDAPAKFMISDSLDDSLPILMASASDICSPLAFRDAQGDIQLGTRNCSVVPDCTAGGQVGCKTVANYISAESSQLTPGIIKAGVTIAGTKGEYPSSNYPLAFNTGTPDLDNTLFDTRMKSSAIFEYFDSSGTKYNNSGSANIVAEKIAKDVDIFGTTGTLTSPAAWDLRVGSQVVTPAGTVTGKLKANCRNAADLATFDQANTPVKVTIDTVNDTLTTSLANGFASGDRVRIYYATSTTASPPTAQPSPLVPSTTYYVVSPVNNAFQLASTTNGSAIDIAAAVGTNVFNVYVYRWGNGTGTAEIWDTIDDYINGSTLTIPLNIPSYPGWTSDNLCGGIEVTTDDANVWKDVTTVSDTDDSLTPCSPSTLARCSYKDKISGLEWRKPDNVGREWDVAVTFCDSLNYNGKTDWRLPTQKELYSAYVDGIATTVGNSNWVTKPMLSQYYWTSTTSSGYLGDANYLVPNSGTSQHGQKTSKYQELCVRP